MTEPPVGSNVGPMVYVVRVVTALGRELPETDWRGIHRDRILRFLYRRETNFINQNVPPPSIESLMDITGLDEADARGVCEGIVSDGLAVRIGGSYMLTSNGRIYVEHQLPISPEDE